MRFDPSQFLSLTDTELSQLELSPFAVIRHVEHNLQPDSDEVLFLHTYNWVFFPHPVIPFNFEDVCHTLGVPPVNLRSKFEKHFPGIHRRYNTLLKLPH
jgi:hypothetical protein